MQHSPSRYTATSKRDKNHKIPQKKNRSLLVHIFELSTAVAKVYRKARINAGVTQNQCSQCVTPPLTHVEIPRLLDATELNNDSKIKFVDVDYQTEANLSISPKAL